MAAETPITGFNMTNTGDVAKREAFSLWYNKRTLASSPGTLSTPVWELVGYKLESADMGIDYETDETKKDIIGNTFVELAGPNRSFDLSDWNVIQGSQLQVDCVNALRYEKNGGMAYLESGGDFCLVHHYAGTSSALLAERWKACSIKPGRLGGDGGANLTTDITITMGGDKEIGTAAISAGGVMTFTKTDAPSAWPSSLS